jgi:hypothetical protein
MKLLTTSFGSSSNSSVTSFIRHRTQTKTVAETEILSGEFRHGEVSALSRLLFRNRTNRSPLHSGSHHFEQTTAGIELHPWNRIVASVFCNPVKRKTGDSKTVVHFAAYRIHDHKSITFRSTPPTRNRIVASKFDLRLRSFTYTRPKPAELLSDDWRRRLAVINVLNHIVAEPWSRWTRKISPCSRSFASTNAPSRQR